jgi:hypothetical protein
MKNPPRRQALLIDFTPKSVRTIRRRRCDGLCERLADPSGLFGRMLDWIEDGVEPQSTELGHGRFSAAIGAPPTTRAIQGAMPFAPYCRVNIRRRRPVFGACIIVRVLAGTGWIDMGTTR